MSISVTPTRYTTPYNIGDKHCSIGGASNIKQIYKNGNGNSVNGSVL